MRQTICVAVLVSLAGCQLIKTTSSTPTTTSDPVGAASGTITMPNLVGMTEDQAAAAVKSAGFMHDMEWNGRVECENAPKVEGLVNCQAPEVGKSVPQNTLVQVTIYRDHTSQGEKDSQLLRTLIGMTPDAAEAKVKSWNRGWKVQVIQPTHFDAKCGDNRVCGIENLGAGGYNVDAILLQVNPRTAIAAPPPD